ncbi:MAG: Rab family GTPase, partial [Candidatus Hodarchaeales archaeon]
NQTNTLGYIIYYNLVERGNNITDFNDVNEHLMKICVLGNPQKVKTTIIHNFAEGKFTTNRLPTLGVDITTKKIQIGSNNIKLIIVDTAGQEFFRKLRPSYYRGASAVIIMFDKGYEKSLEVIKEWVAEFRNHISDPEIPLTLVGIRDDTEKISTKDGSLIAKKLNAKYYELKQRRNHPDEVETIFREITTRVLESESYQKRHSHSLSL